jgi:ATP-binding cassette, subfamily B, heavy metal transporter
MVWFNAIVSAGIAATLQLFRLAITLIGLVSSITESKSKGNSSKKSSAKAFFGKGPNYGSVASTEFEADSQDQTDTEHGVDSRRTEFRDLFIAKISLVSQIFLAIYFMIESFPTENIWMRVSSVAFSIGALLVLVDLQRSRFGMVQRFCHTAVTIILWIGSFQAEARLDVPIILFVYTLFTLFESYVTHMPIASTSVNSKARLSAKAITTLLKPYFWPDATDNSAVVNRVRAILTWVCVIMSKVCNLTSPIFLGWASTAITRHNYKGAMVNASIYALIGFFGSTFKESQSLIYLKVAQAAFVQLSEVTFAHLHSLSLDWHITKKLGEVLRSMDRGIAACDTLMKYLFLWLVPAFLETVVVCIIFASYFKYWPMALAVFYYVFLYVVWTIVLTLWRKKFRKAVVESDNEWHDLSTDSLINFETVKFFTAESYELKRFSDAVKRYQSGSVNVQASLSLLNVSQNLILQMCLATALSLAAMGIQKKVDCCLANGCEVGNSECCSQHQTCVGMEVGDFVAVLSYTLQLFAPLNFLGSIYNAVIMALIDLTNLSELLAEDADVVDAKDAFPLPTVNEKDPDIAVEFDNVFFHYPSQPSNQGLKGLSFKMRRGTTTAIVGPTGAGKTTISRLLFRFYDVKGGAVKINGVDIRSVTQSSLRGAIGVVPQGASMFNDTLRANVAYGRRDATQEELDQAAEDAQLTNFIQSLELGWDTMVGDRGLKLSGGEKQRTAIARCLLKDPPFVLLDEATSALDTITEASVQDALDRLGSQRTVLVIAHRLGTIRNADNIIVLKDGVVHEQGTHDELLARGGQYADMWNMQINATRNNSQGFLSDMDTI